MRLIKLKLLFFLIIILSSCTTCPKETEVEDKEKGFLVVAYIPEIEVFSPDNKELKKMLNTQYELYSYIEQLFILCEGSDDFEKESLSREMDFLKENLSWLESVIKGN